MGVDLLMHLPFPHLNNHEKIALAVIALFALLFFKPLVAGDGVGYYVVLEGTVRDHTFNLSNQLRYNEVFNGTAVFYHEQSGQYVSQYAPGMALLSAPFYAASLVLDDFSLFHVKDDFFLRERGDILIHQMAAITAPLILLAVALLLSLEICKLEGLKTGALALVLAFFGTPIIRYATYDLFYTHVTEAGLLAIVLYVFFTRKPALFLGVLIGIMTLVRYTSTLFLIPFALYYIWKNHHREVVNLAVGFAPFLLLLAAFNFFSFGNPLLFGYALTPSTIGAVQGNFDIVPVGVVTALFSTQSGLIVWSPLVLLALWGLWKWNDNRKWVLFGIFTAVLWSTSAFYHGTTGYSFSNRYYAALFPVFVIGIALFLQRYAKLLWLAGVLALYNLLLFFFALAGYFPGIFPSLPAIWNYWFTQGNITHFPQLVIEKTGFYRLIFEK